MAPVPIYVKRTTVSGRTVNTTASYATNSQYISTGEFGMNLTDGKLFSSNGTSYFEVGANLINQFISNVVNFSTSTGSAGSINKINLLSNSYGIGISPSSLDYISALGGSHTFYTGSTLVANVNASNTIFTSTTSFSITSNNISINGTNNCIGNTIFLQTPNITNQGSFIQWNRNIGDGATWIINQKGSGTGGINFAESTSANVVTSSAYIAPAGGNSYVNGYFTSSGFVATASSGVSLQLPASGAIRDVSNGGVMFFDVGTGSSNSANFAWRISNTFGTYMQLNTSSLSVSANISTTGFVNRVQIIDPNSNSFASYVGFYTNDNLRRGYIGYSDGSNNIVITTENSWGISIPAPIKITNTFTISGITTLSNTLNINGITTVSNTLNINGTANASSVIISNTLVSSVATIAANGTTQATATPLTKNISIVATGTGGVILQNTIGEEQIVVNRSAATIQVYPPTGVKIESGAANANVAVTNTANFTFMVANSTVCYQIIKA